MITQKEINKNIKYKDIKAGPPTTFWKIKVGYEDILIPDDLIKRIIELIFKGDY